MIAFIASLWWRFVFWYKQRTGFLILAEGVTALGTVINVEALGGDGDRNFDLELDPGQDYLITAFGGRRTYQRAAGRPALHCEIPPWARASLRDAGAALVVGDRVRVTGTWAFDGVHLGRSMWIEVLAAIVRHQPNVLRGWFEIHPVTAVERVS